MSEFEREHLLPVDFLSVLNKEGKVVGFATTDNSFDRTPAFRAYLNALKLNNNRGIYLDGD